jgi:hypothetical protein
MWMKSLTSDPVRAGLTLTSETMQSLGNTSARRAGRPLSAGTSIPSLFLRLAFTTIVSRRYTQTPVIT